MNTRFFQPSAIEALTGVSPTKLRDWRRRGLIDDLGVYALPGGSWTTDAKHPDIGDRPTWAYRQGDVLCLAVAVVLTGLGLELTTALDIARDVRTPLRQRIEGKAARYRFMIAYPSAMGAVVQHEDKPTQAALLSDLNSLSKYGTPGAIVVDLEHMAASLPEQLWEALGNE